MVLQEHEWNVEDALHVLQMFSDSGGSGFPPLIALWWSRVDAHWLFHLCR